MICSWAKRRYNQNIGLAIENFDFKRVRIVMDALGWTWADSCGKTPSINNMMNCIMELFEHCLRDRGNSMEKTGRCSCSTGGFKVTLFDNEFGVKVEFIAEEVTRPF